jgi:hypothetical protein
MIDAGRYLQNIREHVISRLIEDGRADYAARIAACDYHGFRCNLPNLCPVCRYSRALRLRDRLLAGVRANLEQGARLVPVTLTVPDVAFRSLRQTFAHMRECVRRVAAQIAGLTGVAWSFESLPSNQDIDDEHPHWHGLLAIDPLRNRGARYTSGLAIHEQWAACEPGGVADVSSLPRPVMNFDDPIFARARMDKVAERHAKYAAYMLKSSPEQVIQQTANELEHGFTERIHQLGGLHRVSITGSLQQQPAQTAA